MTTNQKSVNKEAVRMLVQDFGYQEASKQTGIAYGTLRQWAKRGKWNGHVPKYRDHSTVTNVTATAPDAHVAIMTARKEQSAAHLSKYVLNASDTASKLNGKRALKDAQNVRHVAAVREHLWPQEKQAQSNVMVNIALLGVQPDQIQVKGETLDLTEGSETGHTQG